MIKLDELAQFFGLGRRNVFNGDIADKSKFDERHGRAPNEVPHRVLGHKDLELSGSFSMGESCDEVIDRGQAVFAVVFDLFGEGCDQRIAVVGFKFFNDGFLYF